MDLRTGRWPPIFIAATGAIVVAGLGGLATDIGPWYRALEKPWWQPPDLAFGPVWTLIFTLTAAAAVLAWRGARTSAQRTAIVLAFAANGVLNVFWSVLFFTVKRPDWALGEVVFLWASIVVLIVVAGRSSRTASLLLLPYLAWVSFAAVLNLAIVRLNSPFGAA